MILPGDLPASELIHFSGQFDCDIEQSIGILKSALNHSSDRSVYVILPLDDSLFSFPL